MFTMKSSVISIILIFSVSSANASTLLNFDTLIPGELVADAYLSNGVVFDTPGWLVMNSFSGILIIPSSPNYIHLNQPTTTSLRFVSPTDPAVPATTTFFQFDNVGLVAGYGFTAGLEIVAKDINGTILDSASVPYVAVNQGRSIFTTALNGSAIHSIEFTTISNPAGGALLPIDNIQFGNLTAVPVPAAFWLFGSALSVIGLIRKLNVFQKKPNIPLQQS